MWVIISALLSLGTMWFLYHFVGKGKIFLLGWYPTWEILAIESVDKQLMGNGVGFVIAIWLPYLLMLFVVFSGDTKTKT